MPYKIYNFSSFLFVTLFLQFIFSSCQKDPNQLQFEIGSDLISVESRITICDTFSIELSTVQIDSLVTSGAENLLVGKLEDERLGKLTSKCYFRILTPATIPISEGDIYDSICLIVNLNGYYFGDTTLTQKWNVFNLSEDMEANENGYLYNNSSFMSYEDPLGQISFKAYPSKEQQLEIPLNHSYGNSLFNLLINNYEDISTSANFYKHFRGMLIEPAQSEMKTFLGINTQDTSIIMRLYAHSNDEEKEELQVDFNLETGTLPFSQITSDRSSSLLSNIKNSQDIISSNYTDNESFIQGGSGLVTRIDIPGLAKALEIEHAVLVKAELILQPVLGTYQLAQLPQNIIFRKCDNLNRIVNTYIDATTSDYVYGTLEVADPIYNENTYYKIDITQYVNDELADNYFVPGTSGILLSYNDRNFNSTANSVVIGNSAHETQKAKIRLYFLYYE